MKPNREEIRLRLLDGRPPEATEAQVRGAAEGDEMLGEALEVAPLIHLLDENSGQADGLAPEAIERSWIRIAARVKEPDAASESAGPARDFFAALFAARPKRWAMSAAAIVLALSAVTYLTTKKPMARLAFSASEVRIEDGRTRSVAPGIHDLALRPHAQVHTGALGAIVRLESGVDLLVAGGTRTTYAGGRDFMLEVGSLWIEVAKGGAGFSVTTAEAMTRVTGTSFGVQRDERGTIVSVVEGSVSVRSFGASGEEVELRAGESVLVTAAGGSLGIVESSGSAPAWAVAIRDQATAASVGALLPSVTSGGPAPRELP